MNILVFGKTGQVGRELARQGDVTSIGRDQADLTDPDACSRLIAGSDADVIINAAAYTNVDQAETDEAVASLVNGAAPKAMATEAARKGVPFLHISTDYVFDGQGDRAWLPHDEPAPLGAYGRSKLAGETDVLSAGGVAVILRTSWVFSAHGGNFVKSMLRLGRDHKALTIVADQVGGPTAAADIAAGLLKMAAAIKADPSLGGIYHMSGAPDVSWADFAREIFAQVNLSVAVRDIASAEYPTAAVRPGNSRLDCRSLEQAFGIQRPDWRQSLTSVLHELREI